MHEIYIDELAVATVHLAQWIGEWHTQKVSSAGSCFPTVKSACVAEL